MTIMDKEFPSECPQCSGGFETDHEYPSSIGIETNRHVCQVCRYTWQTLKEKSEPHSFVAPWIAKRMTPRFKGRRK
jgi:hypothetical protein